MSDEENDSGEEMDWELLEKFAQDFGAKEKKKDPTVLEEVSLVMFNKNDEKSFSDIQPYLTERTAKEVVKVLQYRLPFGEPEIFLNINLN